MSQPAARGAPRREERREEILEAAASAIAARGFHGMSMRSLARASGRSLAGLYTYFESKHDVLFALHVRAFEALLDSARELLDKSDEPAEQLYLLIANHLGYFIEHGDVMRVLVQEASSLPAEQRTVVRQLKERYFELGRAIVARIVTRAEADEVERAAYSVFGMLNWVYGWYTPGRHGGAREVAHTIHELALGGLVASHDAGREARERVDHRVALGELRSPLKAREQAA